jgi:hypothetical protein
MVRRWIKLHDEELHNLYCSSNQVKDDEMGRAYSTHGKKRNAYQNLVGKPEEKTSLERPRHRCKDNIKMDLTVINLRAL